MSDNKIIHLKNYQKSQKKSKMLFLAIIIGALLGFVSWNYFVENVATIDVQIPPSNNIAFNNNEPQAMTTNQVANEFEQADNKPILLYIYTTWCKICSNNFETINEISREFQNTDLQVITLAIDRDLSGVALQQYLNHFGNVYFHPRFLSFKEGFVELLGKRNINYNNRIPFTVLISRNGEVITKFTGLKSKNFLRNKIIKELYGK